MGRCRKKCLTRKLRDALKNSTAQWQGAPEHAFLAERTGTLKDAGKKVDILVQVEGLPIVAIESSYDRRRMRTRGRASARLVQEMAHGGYTHQRLLSLCISRRSFAILIWATRVRR